jgi:hypothetical protein
MAEEKFLTEALATRVVSISGSPIAFTLMGRSLPQRREASPIVALWLPITSNPHQCRAAAAGSAHCTSVFDFAERLDRDTTHLGEV